jgi:ElaB/YqjD/DUF883 family membrane-anchored ribosome-binding protein
MSKDQGDPAARAGGIKSLEKDAAALMAELSRLSEKLKAAASAGADTAQAGASALADELRTLESRVSVLSSESRKALTQLDQSVRTNPYLYILGALGLGFLLGKAKRS